MLLLGERRRRSRPDDDDDDDEDDEPGSLNVSSSSSSLVKKKGEGNGMRKSRMVSGVYATSASFSPEEDCAIVARKVKRKRTSNATSAVIASRFCAPFIECECACVCVCVCLRVRFKFEVPVGRSRTVR